MENGQFMDDFPRFDRKMMDFCVAMLNNHRAYRLLGHSHPQDGVKWFEITN